MTSQDDVIEAAKDDYYFRQFNKRRASINVNQCTYGLTAKSLKLLVGDPNHAAKFTLMFMNCCHRCVWFAVYQLKCYRFVVLQKETSK